MTPTEMSEMAKIIKAEVRAAVFPSLQQARALIGEAGVPAAQVKLAGAIDGLEAAQAAHREAVAAERLANEAHDQATLDAKYDLDAFIVREGNKTFIVTEPKSCPKCVGRKESAAGVPCELCAGTGVATPRRQVTADEAQEWKAAEARKAPEVIAAKRALTGASEKTYAARDAVTVADKRLQVCRHELDAAVAVLGCLTAGLAAGKGA